MSAFQIYHGGNWQNQISAFKCESYFEQTIGISFGRSTLWSKNNNSFLLLLTPWHLTSERCKQVRYQFISACPCIILYSVHDTYHATAATAAPGGKIHSHCPGIYAKLNMLIISKSCKHGRTQLMPIFLGYWRLLLAHSRDLLYWIKHLVVKIEKEKYNIIVNNKL